VTSDKPHSPYRAAISDETRAARKHHAPAAARNTVPILDVLRGVLPETGRALEIASGTGQHAAAFAEAFPGIGWQPSDQDASARDSIAAWVAESGLGNLLPPVDIDVMRAGWPRAVAGELDLIVCINMIHISPWAACEGLMEGADELLREGGLLYLYGPYKRDGGHTASSNAAFDESLRSRNPAWGIRDMGDVEAAAGGQGMATESTVAMPANNFSVIFRKRGAS
jgi:SAM-dependent methyltransferase